MTARRIVRRHWDLIVHLADHLEVMFELSGEEIAELLDRYSGVLHVGRDDIAVDR